MVCRCGWDGVGVHPCHRCGFRPGTIRFYNITLPALSGNQMKVQAQDTYGCDECWSEFSERK